MSDLNFTSKHTSAYYIALAAWRRGLSVTFVKNSQNFKIRSQKKTLFFCQSAMVGGRSGLTAHEICKDKNLTKRYLAKNGITVPLGKLFFSQNNKADMFEFAKRIGYPVVIKPNSDGSGLNVFASIKNQDELFDVIKNQYRWGISSGVLLEKYISGEDYRLFVVGDKVTAALKRTPASITGDGFSKIKTLIEWKNSQKKKNPWFKDHMLKVDMELLSNIKKTGLSINSVLPNGKTILLRSKVNLSAGGNSEDVTNTVPEQIKALAVKSIEAIPGLSHGSVDILYDKLNENATVLEINSMGQLVIHVYPSKGISRDTPGDVIDYYFPESIINKALNKNLFFNMHIVECFSQNCPEAEYTLPPVPDKDIAFRQLILQGDFDSPSYKIWLRNHARRLNLSGFAKDINDKTIKVVLVGSKTDIDLFYEICENDQQNAKIQKIKGLDYRDPIVWGFYLV